MKTLSYIYANNIEEIKVGEKYYFGQLAEGNGDLEELIKSGSIAIYNESDDDYEIVNFEIVEREDDILKSIVLVTNI